MFIYLLCLYGIFICVNFIIFFNYSLCILDFLFFLDFGYFFDIFTVDYIYFYVFYVKSFWFDCYFYLDFFLNNCYYLSFYSFSNFFYIENVLSYSDFDIYFLDNEFFSHNLYIFYEPFYCPYYFFKLSSLMLFFLQNSWSILLSFVFPVSLYLYLFNMRSVNFDLFIFENLSIYDNLNFIQCGFSNLLLDNFYIFFLNNTVYG